MNDKPIYPRGQTPCFVHYDDSAYHPIETGCSLSPEKQGNIPEISIPLTYDPSKPLKSIDDIEVLRDMTEKLWSIIDHIDTLSDQCKTNDIAYRRAAEAQVKKRFNILASDGYDLFLPNKDKESS